MRDLAFFIGGFACCVWLIWGVLKLQDRHDRRHDRCNGYLDFTPLSASHEGRDASAYPGSDGELSGGGTSPAPRHLTVIDGGE